MDLKKEIISSYRNLTASQKKVADFVINHSYESAFLSITGLAKRTGASEASVFRFAQRIGFENFSDFRQVLEENLKKEIKPESTFSVLKENEIDESIIASVVKQDVKNINDTILNISEELFEKVTGLILKAKFVYTFGLGVSSILSDFLSYQLNQVSIRAKPLAHGFSTLIEQIPFVKRNDLLIGFSFPPYSRETIDAAIFAKESKIPLISVTDKETSPITFYSTLVMPVSSYNFLFTNSITANVVIINAIVTNIAKHTKREASKIAEDVNKILYQQKYYKE